MQLTPSDHEYLALNMGDATRVRRRSQFVLWIQGSFQALLPHRSLIIALTNGDGQDDSLEIDMFSREPVAPALMEMLNGSRDALTPRVIRRWRQRGGDILFGGAQPDDPEYECFGLAMTRARIEQLVGQGVRDLRGQFSSFYLFSVDPNLNRERFTYCLELLLPLVQSAYCRVLANERSDAFTSIPTSRVLTDRETEVLRWVQRGKSNAAIAAVLSISPLTVKNHLQKILKKLNADNRAQAVSQGIARKIISFEPFR